MLRGLGIGIPTIRRFLAGGAAERTAILSAEAQRIERELAQRRFALEAIARFGSTGTLALIVDTTALIYALFGELHAAGRDVLSPVFCMNDDTGSEEHIVVHACVRVDAPVPNLPQARIVDVPGGEFAVVTHVGPYEQLGLAYHALHAWAQEHGHEPRGLIREIYVNDPANAPPAALQTELLLPL